MPDNIFSNNGAILSPPSWQNKLASIKQSPEFQSTLNFVHQRRLAGKTIYPQKSDIFRAFALTHYADVKVVILGQDPYHGQQNGIPQANGLAFSVKPEMTIPPSLVNIFKELDSDIGRPSIARNGDLSHWAKQGVLLLNTVLTVEAGQANSHKQKGWETFTDQVIHTLSTAEQHIVFLLWGKPAQRKIPLIAKHHTILSAPHPSPLSAYRGFLGCQHFSRTNTALVSHQQSPINW